MEKELSTQNLKHDSFDQSKFVKMFYNTDLKTNITNHVQEYNQFPELTQDLFYSLYKYGPSFEDPDKINSNYQMNREFIEKSMGTQAYQQLRAYTKLNEGSAAIAAATLGENILTENEETFKKLKEQQKKIDQHKQNLKKMQQEINQLKQPDPNGKKSFNQQQQLKDMVQKAKKTINTIKQLQNQQKDEASQIQFYSAMQNTAENIKAQEELLGSIGRGSGAGSEQKVSVEERIQFSKLFLKNKNFGRLIKILGRMKRLAEKKQREKTKHSIETIDDIKQSNDLQHVVASELLYLVDPELEILFDKKFIESELLTYELTGRESKSKGPIIACLDISGSMSGEKDATAKAIALALVMIAQKQKRDSVIILFDHGIRKVFEFDKAQKEDFDMLVKLAEFFSGGGTSFTEPLQKAIGYFTTDAKYTKADLIWITDGDGSISEPVKVAFKELKHEKKINCYSIIIGGSDYVDHTLKDISNTLVNVSDLTDETVANLFESI